MAIQGPGPVSSAKPKDGVDYGAGLTTKQSASSLQNDESSQASRALALGSYFLSGSMAINVSQFLGGPLYLINEDWYNAWIAFTKQSWGLLIMTMTQCWAPTVVRVSGHKSVRGQLHKTMDGSLLSTFPERLVLIANHQIYTDWLYLWWIAYTAGMHGRVYIVLKESLKKIPILGWGMQFSQFIFLKRNWEQDKHHLSTHLQKLNKASDPMWLMMFPEGTNLADCTRANSKKWADKNNIDDMQHQLLPRSTGLQFCLQELHKTVDYVYDCTIAYEGVPRGQYAQDIYTLGASYFGGNPPKSVNMYWRRFAVSDIPINDSHAFEHWLRARWTEKDRLIEGYYRTGRFPADTGVSKGRDGKIRRGAGYIDTEVKPTNWYDFLQVFAPIGLFALVLYVFYGALPRKIAKSIDRKAIVVEAMEKNNIKIPDKPELLDSVLKAFGNETFGVKNARTTQKLAMDQGTIRKALESSSLHQKTVIEALRTHKLALQNGVLVKGSAFQNAPNKADAMKEQVNGVKKQPQMKAAASKPTANKPANPSPKKLEVKQGGNSARKKLEPMVQVTPALPKPLPKKLDGSKAAAQTIKKSAAKQDSPPAPKKLEVKHAAPKQPSAKSAPVARPKTIGMKDDASSSTRSAPKKLEIRPKVNSSSKQA